MVIVGIGVVVVSVSAFFFFYLKNQLIGYLMRIALCALSPYSFFFNISTSICLVKNLNADSIGIFNVLFFRQ